MHMPHMIRIHADKDGLGISRKIVELIRAAAIVALDCENVKFDCVIEVKLTDDEGIREINREMRSIDTATDVLSFPAIAGDDGCISPAPYDFDQRTGRLYLGDIAISIPRARAQGVEYGHGLLREVAFLTVHSVMHLLGYDHVDTEERRLLMREHEERALAFIGLSRGED